MIPLPVLDVGVGFPRADIETLLRITIDNHGGDPSAGSATA